METMDKRFLRGQHTIDILIKEGRRVLNSEEEYPTIDEVCVRCGITKGAFFHHFANKDIYWETVISIDMSDYMANVIKMADCDYPDDCRKQIKAWIDGVTKYSGEHGGKALSSHRGITLLESKTICTPWISRVDEHLKNWQEIGKIRDDVPYKFIHDYLDCLTHSIHALGTQHYIHVPLDEKLINSFIDTIVL